MDKFQFFRLALKFGRWRTMIWVISLFAVKLDRKYDPATARPYDLVILESDPTSIYTVLEDTSKTMKVEGLSPKTPPFTMDEVLVLGPGDLANVKSTVTTTCGTAILNAIVLVDSFGSKIDYIADRLSSSLDSLVISRWVDEPDLYGTPQESETDVYVDEVIKYLTNVAHIAAFTQIAAPAASPKAITVSKAVLARRDELIAEYGEQLKDPAILARVVDELAKMDMADFKDDPASGFFLGSKSFYVNRMKQYIMYGLEYGFDKTDPNPALILTPLADGMDIDTFTKQVDGSRAGSFDRGSQTALGGARVKEIYRALQNLRIIDGDCGTTVGMNTYIKPYNIKALTGRLGISASTGEPKPLTKRMLEANIGKRLMIRSFMGCKASPNVCAVCVGRSYATNPDGAPIIVAQPPSVMMNDMMKSMHGRALKTARFNYLVSMT